MTLKTYIDFYESHLDAMTQKAKVIGSGGAVRATNANLVEGLAEKIWCEETGGEVKKEHYEISNPKGDKLKFAVDKHCYSINGKLKLVLECKAYLDRCFLARADHDMSMIEGSQGKDWGRDIQFSILALENACSDDALKFYLGRNNLNCIFFLLDGRRASNRPIWKAEHRKAINKQLLQGFVKYVRSLK